MTALFDFSDTTVVVVGGTSGINRGIAECFARNGAKVVVASRSQQKIDDTVASLQTLGASAMGFQCDVRDLPALEAGFKQVNDSFGEIDTLISGAAGNFPAMLNDMSSNGFKAVMDIDLLGTFHVMKAAFPYLKKPGASVINISAPQAFVPMLAQAHVCAAKAGVDMITRCLAMEWGGAGIRVNSIVPGPIQDTEGMDRLAPTDAHRAEVIRSVPLGRMGEKDDLARAAAFLGSDLASFVSGIVMPVDGGWSTSGVAGLSDTLGQIAQAQG